MLRVLLRVDQVSMRIKEAVQIHLVVRKGQKNFTHIRSKELNEGELTLDATSQFFIGMDSPRFDIQVYLIKGSLRKKGGVVHVDLRQLAISSSHRIKAHIKDSPLQNSNLYVDLMYMLAQNTVPVAEMLSVNQIETDAHEKLIYQLTQQNQLLQLEGSRLKGEVKGLMQGNKDLGSIREHLQSNLSLQDVENRAEMQEMREQKQESFDGLEREKGRLARVVERINTRGNVDIIKKMADIFSRMDGSNSDVN